MHWLSFSIVIILIFSSGSCLNSNSRHVCFFNKYSDVKGPHFSALLDQMVEQTIIGNHRHLKKRVAFIVTNEEESEKTSTRKLREAYDDNDNINQKTESSTVSSSSGSPPKKGKQQKRRQELMDDLDLEVCQSIVLNKSCNPQSLRAQIQQLDPTIIWVADAPNSFLLRYYMKISNFDGIMEELVCGSEDKEEKEGNDDSKKQSILYVGEGAGAICGGSDLIVGAKEIRGENPRESPEPQFFGLKLLGPERSVFFIDKDKKNNDSGSSSSSSSSSLDKDDSIKLSMLEKHQVFVWSQEGSDATSFLMNAKNRGAIENLSFPEPVPPLYVDMGGRKCTGEPSIDPSRMVQMMNDDDDSELFWDGDFC